MFFLLTRQPRRAPPRRLPLTPKLEEDDEGVVGCGWFDSSHDLRLGLLATELPPDDPLSDALGLKICVAAGAPPLRGAQGDAAGCARRFGGMNALAPR